MTKLDDGKEKAFAAIKDSIPPGFEDPNEEQQKAIDALDRQSGFHPTPAVTGKVALLVQDASEVIMQRHRFLTIEETKEILVYDNGVYKTGGETLIAKVLEAEYGYELNNNSLSQIIGHVMRRTYYKREELDANINIINLRNGQEGRLGTGKRETIWKGIRLRPEYTLETPQTTLTSLYPS